MRFFDIRDLVIGLLTVIFLSIAFGQYGHLQDFAKRQAAQALKPWPAHRFFPQSYVERSFRSEK